MLALECEAVHISTIFVAGFADPHPGLRMMTCNETLVIAFPVSLRGRRGKACGGERSYGLCYRWSRTPAGGIR
jgi:hypothetical protein